MSLIKVKMVTVTLTVTSIFALAIPFQPIYAQSHLKGISKFYGTDLNEG